MIERYFVKGATFSWAAPPPIASNNDGSIGQSGINAPPGMSFVGWEAGILAGTMPPPNLRNLALNFNVPYVWLNYVLGQTAYVQPGASDVLTGFMSGCWICTWTQGGIRTVGHVGTVESAPKNAPPNSTVKTTFLNTVGAQDPNVTGYNPAAGWGFDEIARVIQAWKNPPLNKPQIMSLVTANNEYYAILMIAVQVNMAWANRWVCGGKKRVNPSNLAAITLGMQ